MITETQPLEQSLNIIQKGVMKPVWDYFLKIVTDDSVMGEDWKNYITDISTDPEADSFEIIFDECVFWMYYDEIHCITDGNLQNVGSYPAYKKWNKTEEGDYVESEWENWDEGELISWKPGKKVEKVLDLCETF
jgi:hypothetical protein